MLPCCSARSARPFPNSPGPVAACGIVARRLASPAIFFLESGKPLGYVASQALYFFKPIVETVMQNPAAYDRLAELLARRGAVELLLRRLEERA